MRSILAATTCMVALTGSTCALAQTATADSASSAKGIQTVVVTAQKRKQDLQKTPITVQVIQGKDIENKGQTQLSQVLKDVPGVKIQQLAGGDGASITIRGVGQTQADPQFQQSPDVAVNVDGRQTVNPRSVTQTMFDVGRVEVLSGPQGTLYGASAVGGVVNIVSNPPKIGVWEGKILAEFGNYGDLVEGAVLNVPVRDWFALRILATKDYSQGFISGPSSCENYDSSRNPAGMVSCNDHGMNNTRTLRVKALFKPTENFTAPSPPSTIGTTAPRRISSIPAVSARTRALPILPARFCRKPATRHRKRHSTLITPTPTRETAPPPFSPTSNTPRPGRC